MTCDAALDRAPAARMQMRQKHRGPPTTREGTLQNTQRHSPPKASRFSRLNRLDPLSLSVRLSLSMCECFVQHLQHLSGKTRIPYRSSRPIPGLPKPLLYNQRGDKKPLRPFFPPPLALPVVLPCAPYAHAQMSPATGTPALPNAEIFRQSLCGGWAVRHTSMS
ncbi:hypothetical protein LX36DRAFT_651499 [Colletotrichum falcatum]|nr:hypothetical protein LX36DRAFT_651499 [Colletotrichum falcatum]